MRSIDVHQHLWPEEFVAALARRTAPPRLKDDELDLGEGGRHRVDLAAHDVDERVRALDRNGVDLALVSLQPTLGIEALALEERKDLLDTWHRGMREVVAGSGGRLAALSAGAALDGFAGATVPAPALVSAFRDSGASNAGDSTGIAELLGRLEGSGRFLFVHPGFAAQPDRAPAWWASGVPYTAQMQAAYLAWVARGAEAHSALPVVFALLAGGAPVQLERLRSSGLEPRAAVNRNVFLDTASYGRRALELCLATFGVGQLVYGSDVPVLDPEPTLRALAEFGDAVADAVRKENPSLLLA